MVSLLWIRNFTELLKLDMIRKNRRRKQKNTIPYDGGKLPVDGVIDVTV